MSNVSVRTVRLTLNNDADNAMHNACMVPTLTVQRRQANAVSNFKHYHTVSFFVLHKLKYKYDKWELAKVHETVLHKSFFKSEKNSNKGI